MSKKHGNLIITNANIWEHKELDTIIIENGVVKKICKGTNLENISSKYTYLDIKGRMVIPGLADAHMHLYGYSLSLMHLDLRGTMSIEELKKRLYDFYRRKKSGWIIGRGWDQENFKEKRYPTRWDLDEVVSDVPVVLTRVCGHVIVVNTKALEIAGIDKNVNDPLGGKIGRDESGDLNGLFFEKAMDLIYSKIPEPSFKEKKKALLNAIKEALSYGLTELHAMSVTREELNLYKRVFRKIPSPIKIKLYLELNLAEEINSEIDIGHNVRIVGIKVLSDGSLGGRTAALRKPYEDDPSTFGLLTISEEDLYKALKISTNKNMQLAIHAIGDRAIEYVVTLVEKFFKGKYVGKKVRIEHASLLPPDLLDKVRRLGLAISVQPHFILTDWWVVDRLGKRARWVYPLKTIINSCISAASSDAPVEPLNPWLGIYAAVDRGKKEHLDIWGISANEALTVKEALKLYVNGKVLSGTFKNNKIEEGMVADLTIIDRLTLPDSLSDILKMRVYATIVNGNIVYKRDDR
ncbi:MAG: amidohydrolase [Thermoproteales archaeon]|nr:amidohydrolase [Thermoproteales archaeon]